MSVVLRNLIEYSGLCDYIPSHIEDFTTFQVDEFSILPPDKPEIKQISRVSAKINIKNGRLVKSNISTSCSKLGSKNYKYICTLVVNWRVEYIDTCNDSIYSTNVESEITTFIPIINSSKYAQALIPSTFIEDIHVELLSCNSFMLNCSGILIVENC